MYARVVVDTGSTSGIESLTYEIPDGLAGAIGVGSCVLVPLASRQAVGYVIGFDKTPPVKTIRPIIAEIDNPVRLTPEALDLARWISQQYLCPLPRAVAAMLPGVTHYHLQCRVLPLPADSQPQSTPSEGSLLDAIRAAENSTIEGLWKDRPKDSVQRTVRQLEAKGLVKRVWELVGAEGKPRILRGVKAAGSAEEGARLSEKQAAALAIIQQAGREVSIVELEQRHGISRSTVESLQRKGLLEWVDVVLRRKPEFVNVAQGPVVLTDQQQAAVSAISGAVDSRAYAGFLLHGVTASGKTEVYLRCIDCALAAGRTGLVLLPEIAITTQVMNIFKSRFGDQVAVLHSALSAGERCDEWVRIQDGEAKVVLGARSAVFAPLHDVGVIIVDEEHESSYKQDVQPRYHGRDVAHKRARDAGAAFVLGSATPSIESYYLAQQGKYQLLEMPGRVENRPMPSVRVADLRQQYAQGRASIFSQELEEAIEKRLQLGQQVIILQNRRAYSTFLLCRDCGHVMRCPNCAVSLKYSQEQKKLSCHHCDYSTPAPDVCPSCQGRRIGRFGIGTERVAEEVRQRFPEARVLRMDRDTTARKGAHSSILDTFRRGEADILVGTQMIAKGLDFPNVTLVGIISADTSLNLPDFRATERTFQLVSQVSGRSGRGTAPGEVVVQTFDPDNCAIRCAVDHDYRSFYEQELENRRELSYPPFSVFVNVTSRDTDEKLAEKRATDFSAEARVIAEDRGWHVDVLGPQPAVLARLRGEYRWHTVIRAKDRQTALAIVTGVMEANAELRRRLAVDVDPVSML